MTVEILIKNLVTKSKNNMNLNSDIIKKAAEFSAEKHLGQKRLSGEDYVIHPIAVADILLDLKMDTSTIVSALLHDVLEDTETEEQEIVSLFGQEVVKLINGVTKISTIRTSSKFIKEYENLRKFIFSMIGDVRVLFIKLADRLHNMSTLQYQPQPKQVQISNNTLEIYAPLAGRLGIEQIKNQLEDLALYYIDNRAYEYIKSHISLKKDEREEIVRKIILQISQMLEKEGILDYKIKGRAKHFYSIYKKIQKDNKSIDEVFDLFGIRIITKDIMTCYTILGIIHNHFKPIPGRFKDYIALPKSNFYQSIHTTCIDNNKRKLEIQIRDYDMDQKAEYGIAAHWMYKEGLSDLEKIQNEISIFNKLRNWTEDDFSQQNLMENLRTEIFQEELFVFTPNGDVVELPTGSTVLDFAFAIHTNIGLKAIGAKVNGKFVPLRKELKSGEVVEIMTSAKKTPSYDWINVVKTKKAKSKIKAFFRKLYDANKGQKIKIESQVFEKYPNIVKSKNQVEKKNRSLINRKKMPVYVLGDKNIHFTYAKCCNPEPGNAIKGIVSFKKKSVIIHDANCSTLKKVRNQNRIVDVSWSDPYIKYMRKYSISSNGYPMKVIAEIIDIVDSVNVDLSHMEMNVKNDENVKIFCILKTSAEDRYELLEKFLDKAPIKVNFQRVN